MCCYTLLCTAESFAVPYNPLIYYNLSGYQSNPRTTTELIEEPWIDFIIDRQSEGNIVANIT